LGRAEDQIGLLQADVADAGSMGALAESAKVVISTVGPYVEYGEPIVAACAALGTDYVDLCGEPEFVDRMWLGYHGQAQRTGARLVHACGFESIPFDLGALFTVEQLPEGVPIELDGFGQMAGGLSGGTYRSAISTMARLRRAADVARERGAREPRLSSRRVRGRQGAPHQESLSGGWVLPVPTIDPQQVLRSARALDRYGPDFSYSHYLVAGSAARALGLVAGTVGAVALAQLPLTRDLLLKLRAPGAGPSSEQRARSHFRVVFVARSGGQRRVTEVSGGDPGYGETAKMLAESALCLAHDELEDRVGQLTSAVAMGRPLIERLKRAGIGFRVVE
jgi:short subunit dehydrogenase-like uncharacterized protein